MMLVGPKNGDIGPMYGPDAQILGVSGQTPMPENGSYFAIFGIKH
jgi:hypothetical protein